jgi:hypothetical protein
VKQESIKAFLEAVRVRRALQAQARLPELGTAHCVKQESIKTLLEAVRVRRALQAQSRLLELMSVRVKRVKRDLLAGLVRFQILIARRNPALNIRHVLLNAKQGCETSILRTTICETTTLSCAQPL